MLLEAKNLNPKKFQVCIVIPYFIDADTKEQAEETAKSFFLNDYRSHFDPDHENIETTELGEAEPFDDTERYPDGLDSDEAVRGRESYLNGWATHTGKDE